MKLYNSLKRMEGVSLPESWKNVSKARHLTGSARLSLEVVHARLELIRQCLWDLRNRYADALGWDPVATFLDPPLYLLRGLKARGTEELATMGHEATPSAEAGLEYGSTVR